jgi:hypothetical protein
VPGALSPHLHLVRRGLSLIGGILIFTYPIDRPCSATDSLGFVDVKVFLHPVRLLVVIGNILGSLAFIGAALVSVWRFRRRGDVPQAWVTGSL